jgi:membrane protease YdiL (CAAX protease family)
MPWDFWLIFFVLAVAIPWRGRQRLQKLLAMPRVGTAERFALYLSTIAFQWLVAVIVGWRAWTRGISAGQLGLAMNGGLKVAIVSVAGAAAFSLLHWLNLRRVGKLPLSARGPLQSLAEHILPRNRREFLPYLVLAVTAGVCEEFLYRGFVMAVLARTGFALWSTVLISSILFGLAHLYQGKSGFVSTLFVGVVFAVARIAYHSLVPVMLWHATVDIVAGIAGSRYLLTGGDTAPEL